MGRGGRESVRAADTSRTLRGHFADASAETISGPNDSKPPDLSRLLPLLSLCGALQPPDLGRDLSLRPGFGMLELVVGDDPTVLLLLGRVDLPAQRPELPEPLLPVLLVLLRAGDPFE